MFTFGIGVIRRWTPPLLTLGALAVLALPRPVAAQRPPLPALAGFTFDLSLSTDLVNNGTFSVTSQDAVGNFTGSIQRSDRSTPVTGWIGRVVAITTSGQAVIVGPGGDSNGSFVLVVKPPKPTSVGSFWISFREDLGSDTVLDYEGELDVSGTSASITGFAVLLVLHSVRIAGVTVTFPSIEGNFPFTATGRKLPS